MGILPGSIASILAKSGEARPNFPSYDRLPGEPKRPKGKPVSWLMIAALAAIGIYLSSTVLWHRLTPISPEIPSEAKLIQAQGRFAPAMYEWANRGSTKRLYVFNADSGKRIYLTCYPQMNKSTCLGEAGLNLQSLARQDARIGYYYSYNPNRPASSNILVTLRAEGKALLSYRDRQSAIERVVTEQNRFWHSILGMALAMLPGWLMAIPVIILTRLKLRRMREGTEEDGTDNPASDGVRSGSQEFIDVRTPPLPIDFETSRVKSGVYLAIGLLILLPVTVLILRLALVSLLGAHHLPRSITLIAIFAGSLLLWATAKLLYRFGSLSFKPDRLTVSTSGLEIEGMGKSHQWNWSDITGIAMRPGNRGVQYLELALKDTVPGYPRAKTHAIRLTDLWKAPADFSSLEYLKDTIEPVWNANSGKTLSW